MLFSGKENIFMCLVAFQKMFRKIFSDVWLCSWKYHRKHIFYLLLTFSHIFLVTKRIHNIIHSSNHKQNPDKNRQIRTNEGEIAIDVDRRGVWIVLSLCCCVCSPLVFCCVLAECVSLFCACYGNRLKVKQVCKMISGSTSVNFGQTEMIFRKIYFPLLPNAWVLQKIISGNDFQSIQTQP